MPQRYARHCSPEGDISQSPDSIDRNRHWCRWWDSNPHAFLGAQDFKSCASAISPHRQPLFSGHSLKFSNFALASVLLFVLHFQNETQRSASCRSDLRGSQTPSPQSKRLEQGLQRAKATSARSLGAKRRICRPDQNPGRRNTFSLASRTCLNGATSHRGYASPQEAEAGGEIGGSREDT